MPTLPEGNGIDIQNVVFESQPDLTWWRDPDTNRIAGTADGHKAVAQAVEVMLLVERFRWQIYDSNFGTELEDLVGEEYDYIVSELPRRIEEAFSLDNRILSVENFKCLEQNSGILTVSFDVVTVYGTFSEEVEM